MSLNEMPAVTEPEDTRRKIEEQEAVIRGTLWEQMGCPQSKLHMPIDEYMKTFRGRHWFVNGTVLAQAQKTLRIILCPKCFMEVRHGIEGTQFFTTIEDDVMTVFPAVGHFVCHWCGFEEWHPLKHDPRVRMGMGVDMVADKHTFTNQAIQSIGQAIGGPMLGSAGMAGQQSQSLQAQVEQLQQAYAAGTIALPEASRAMGELVRGIQPGMGPILGMTDDERRSLHRLYQQTKGAAPVERRQAIIQKLRDLGKI
jgi:hypothetical protein